jgi:hypothetical protein
MVSIINPPTPGARKKRLAMTTKRFEEILKDKKKDKKSSSKKKSPGLQIGAAYLDEGPGQQIASGAQTQPQQLGSSMGPNGPQNEFERAYLAANPRLATIDFKGSLTEHYNTIGKAQGRWTEPGHQGRVGAETPGGMLTPEQIMANRRKLYFDNQRRLEQQYFNFGYSGRTGFGSANVGGRGPK